MKRGPLGVDSPAVDSTAGGETTDFGGGLSLCDNANATTRELAFDELGPDGRPVIDHMEALRGSYTVPLVWQLNGLQKSSTLVDVQIEPKAMLVYEVWCQPPFPGQGNGPNLIQFWSIQATVSLVTDDGSIIGTLETNPSVGQTDFIDPLQAEPSARGFFLFWASNDASEFDAIPMGAGETISGQFSVVDGKLKGTLYVGDWSASLNDDGCGHGSFLIDDSEASVALSGSTTSDFVARAQQRIESVPPVMARWLVPRLDEAGMLVEEENGATVEVQMRVANPSWSLCSRTEDSVYSQDADIVLESTDESFSLLLDGTGSIVTDADGNLSRFELWGDRLPPVEIDDNDYYPQRFSLSVAATEGNLRRPAA